MPELALSIERLPTGFVLSPLKFSLYFCICFASNQKVSLKSRQLSLLRPEHMVVIAWLLEKISSAKGHKLQHQEVQKKRLEKP